MIEIVAVLKFSICFFIGIPISIFAIYGTLILYYGKIKKRRSISVSTNKEYEPSVSVVIPTHNEASIMTKRIENLLASNYPHDKLEFLFVDDSDDSTPQIINEYSKKYPYIHLLR